MPEGRPCTKQQETGTSKRESYFLWSRVQCQGHASRPQEVQGIVDMTPLTDKQQLQSFLGMINYIGGGVHPQPLISHGATKSNAQKR